MVEVELRLELGLCTSVPSVVEHVVLCSASDPVDVVMAGAGCQFDIFEI